MGWISWRASESKATTPTATPSGTVSRKSAAAAFAASSRDGATSVACIDSEVSIASTTMRCGSLSSLATAGRATASVAATVPASSTTAGR